MIKTKVGIDDMALYVPNLYLPIEALAAARGIPYEKLHKGLDLEAMAMPDVGEDAATMMAEAVFSLIEKNELNPHNIGRLYLGTESALDGAKPTATYAMQLLEMALEHKYGARCFKNCDVVDMTFACIGATDALQNCLDWVRNNTQRIAIVVASDIAKYELGSSGEYTQGAGAVALLVRHNPRLLAIEDVFGVATESVHDFFKPRKSYSKSQLLQDIITATATPNEQTELALQKLEQIAFFANPNAKIDVFSEMPVFDGQYSNQCYTNRAIEAMQNFIAQHNYQSDYAIFEDWRRIIFHLPYAAHARRVGVELYIEAIKQQDKLTNIELAANCKSPQYDDFDDDTAFAKAQNNYLKAISETSDYKAFVHEKLASTSKASSLVGNMYTGSIFLALMSALELELTQDEAISTQKYGFVAYGSGSKSKIFEATLQPEWRDIAKTFGIFERLQHRKAITFEQYERLHKGVQNTPIATASRRFFLSAIGGEGRLEGTRVYRHTAPSYAIV